LALLKKPKKLPKLSKRLVLGYLVLAVIIIILATLYIIKPDQFRLEASFIISGCAAIFAGISALLASRSFELTRGTMRPFLTVQPGDESFNQREHIATLEFHVKNTGPVPANLVTAEIAFFDDSEVIEDDNESKHYPKEPEQPKNTLIFPDAVYNLVQYFDLRRAIDKKLYENIADGKVTVRFRVMYSAQGSEYVTVQTEKLGKGERGLINRAPIPHHRNGHSTGRAMVKCPPTIIVHFSPIYQNYYFQFIFNPSRKMPSASAHPQLASQSWRWGLSRLPHPIVANFMPLLK
jgi:hypothetical protein